MRKQAIALGVALALSCSASARAQLAPQVNPGAIQTDIDRQRQQL